MFGRKKEYPPLLKWGFHKKTWRDLVSLCVDPFARSRTRKLILQGLAQVTEQLNMCKMKMEMWIDGSFVTEKNDPEDSDVVVRITNEEFEKATPVHLKLFENMIRGKNKEQYLCDFYCFVEYSEGHAYVAEGEEMREYWIKQFGFARDGTPKGMALLEIPASMT